MSLPSYKSEFLTACSQAGALKFGSFVLKSKRVSPYFFNAGLFHKFNLSSRISAAFAETLHAYAQENAQFDFDVLFGPAYKGIVLAATTGESLARIDEGKYGDKSWSYNRKEAKDHGEGGSIVGESLKGKRIVIIDDVITAGTAIREAIQMIKKEGGDIVGIVVAVDRQEKQVPKEGEGKDDDGKPRPSAIGQLRKELGVPVMAIITLDDVVEFVKSKGSEEELNAMEAYRGKYRASD